MSAEPLPTYSPRQRRLLKERFFRWIVDESPGSQLLWQKAAERLCKITGLEVPAETLRQNFEPVSQDLGKPRREFKDPARWEALYRFLTSDEVNYLKAHEFWTEAPTHVTLALALADFMHGSSKQPGLALDALRGRFAGFTPGDIDDEEITFDFDFVTAEQHVEVTAHFVRPANDDPFREDRLTFEGCVAAQSSGFVLLLLKESYGRETRCYGLEQTAPAWNPEVKSYQATVWMEYGGTFEGALEAISMPIKEDETATTYALPDRVPRRFVLTRS